MRTDKERERRSDAEKATNTHTLRSWKERVDVSFPRYETIFFLVAEISSIKNSLTFSPFLFLSPISLSLKFCFSLFLFDCFTAFLESADESKREEEGTQSIYNDEGWVLPCKER